MFISGSNGHILDEEGKQIEKNLPKSNSIAQNEDHRRHHHHHRHHHHQRPKSIQNCATGNQHYLLDKNYNKNLIVTMAEESNNEIW